MGTRGTLSYDLLQPSFIDRDADRSRVLTIVYKLANMAFVWCYIVRIMVATKPFRDSVAMLLQFYRIDESRTLVSKPALLAPRTPAN